MKEIKICNRCVMDSTDSTIVFDENGYCNYCNYSITTMKDRYFNNTEGDRILSEIVANIKKENSSNEYDCMIGLSGGLDSIYLAYIMKKKYNLRMLALHVDSGWNTEKSISNIQRVSDVMGIDLKIEKLNEVEFMDLQKAYFLSGVMEQDIPQDHAFTALLFKYAQKNKIKYFLSGANFSSESILQKGEGGVIAADKVNLLDIHKNFGNIELRTIPTISLFERYFKYRFINKVVMIRPLDYMDYRLDNAIKELEEEIGFEYYGGKHQESVFTRFYQNYYLPKKYNYDKRKSHLSSLIVTDQMTREEALDRLRKPFYEDSEEKRDIAYIIDKLGITELQFKQAMELPNIPASTFKVSKWNKLRNIAVKYRNILGE